MTNTAFTGTTYAVDGGQQLVAYLKRPDYDLCYSMDWRWHGKSDI
jgi:hypothetical protein